jgi:endonuclease/exonuclease/phosphatase family metal-dependent hydrolase
MSLPSTLSIMTYNIRGALYDDGANSWPYRAPLNVRLLQQHTPDLIGFQEVHQENLAIFQENHGYTQLRGTPYNDHAPFQYTSIAFNTQHLRLLDSGGFWLSETPEVHSRSWDTSCIRSATWAKLEWLEIGVTFLHLNTHLDHISELARVEGTKLILQYLGKTNLPMVVTGDFNCPPKSAAYRLFEEHGFEDAYSLAGHRDVRWTYHGYQGQAFTPHTLDFDRIDWILLRNWPGNMHVESCMILEDADPPLYPSDHYPVFVKITL